MSIGEKDLSIIDILVKDSRTPYVQIAEKIGLSEAAVRKRITRMQENGIIRKFTIDVEKDVLVRAICLITVDPARNTPEVSEELISAEGVEGCYELTGSYDVIAFLFGSDIKQLNNTIDSIRRVEGILSTNTSIVLRSW